MARDLLEEEGRDLFAGQPTFSRAMKEAMNTVERREPDIDYETGVDDAAFRAGFSRMSSDEEKARYLDKNVGKEQWGKDSFGAYYIRPSGMMRFGKTVTKPVSLDEQRTTRYDLADWAGDLPAVAGGVGMGMAATGVGFLPGIGLAALGAAGGKAIDEVVKNVQGYRERGAGEIAADIGKEGAMSAAGEGVFRALRPVAKFLLGPGASRMTPERATLAKEAQDQGFHIRPGQVTDAPMLSRWEGMVQNIFGDLYGEQNRRAAQAGMGQLEAAAGKSPGLEAAGAALSQGIKAERVKFGEDMARKYGQIDKAVGSPFVPTNSLKRTAQEILESMPKDEAGNVVFASRETQQFLRSVMSLQPHTTAGQMQQVRTILREASEADNLVPGIEKRHARLLRKAADEAFTDATSAANAAQLGIPQTQAERAVELLRLADAEYKAGARKFASPVITNITKDASRTGSVDPDMVVEYVIKPEHAFRVKQVKQAVKPEVWEQVKAAHAEDLMKNIVQKTDDPFKQVFDGKAFRNALDKYGRDTLNEVHGKEWVDSAYKFTDALMLSSKRAKLSGGIVAANVALHPIANLPRLVWMRAIVKLMEQPGTFKYLTEGLKIGPETQAGAAALSRFTAQLVAQAEDETGSARFNITEPPGQE